MLLGFTSTLTLLAVLFLHKRVTDLRKASAPIHEKPPTFFDEHEDEFDVRIRAFEESLNTPSTNNPAYPLHQDVHNIPHDTLKHTPKFKPEYAD